jgi:hypothetical protein
MDKQAVFRKLAWATMAIAMLASASCNAPGDSPAGGTADTNVQAPQPVASNPAAAPTSPMSGPEGKPGLPPLSLGADTGRACGNDSDCAVKDAGSCCGYRPVCVNKGTPTFPEKVKAACAKEGRVGICGFQAIDGCQCVAGKCEGVPMMENSEPLQ